MSTYEYHNAGNTEAQQKEALTYLLTQAATGKAATGVLTGLAVAQTATASGAVLIGAGAGVVQAATLDGASVLVNDTPLTLDVFTANPVGGLGRNDIVIFDSITASVNVLVGTPNATPTDPTIPTSAIPLARLRHAASATTIPTSKIDDLRVKTSVFGGADENFNVRGVPMAGASTAKAGKRIHWGTFTSTDINRSDATGIQASIAHGAGFTPSGATIALHSIALQARVFNFTSTTFDLQIVNSDGTANGQSSMDYTVMFVE